MEKLSDVGSMLMEELPEFADVVDGRNNRKSRNQSAHFGGINNWVGLLPFHWAGKMGQKQVWAEETVPTWT